MIGNFYGVTRFPHHLDAKFILIQIKTSDSLPDEARTLRAAPRGIFDRQVLVIGRVIVCFLLFFRKTARQISAIKWCGETQPSRWHMSTRRRSVVQETWRSRRGIETGEEINRALDTAEWLSKPGPRHPALWSLSSLVTINPPQTNRNPICSNK